MPPYTKVRGSQIVDESVTADKIVYSLDDAYDNGGNGIGRFITSSDGPVIIDALSKLSQSLVVTGTVLVAGTLNVEQAITGTLAGTASFALDSDLLDGRDSTSFAGLTSNTSPEFRYFSQILRERMPISLEMWSLTEPPASDCWRQEINSHW